jgi:membrane protease YdiL (CAAX protease family)
MVKSERIFGSAYLPVHIFLLPLVLAYTDVLRLINIGLSDAAVNLVYYVISFIFVLIFLFRFLKASFYELLDNPLGSLKAIVLAYLLNSFLITVMSILFASFLQEGSNPNTQEIINQTKLDTDVMIYVAVLLAPIVEETLFRGVLFGSVRSHSRLAAYIVSTLVFSVYHLWQYFFIGFDWTVLVYLLQYIPASVALCWCYEKSGSIWAPVILHAAINMISISMTFG